MTFAHHEYITSSFAQHMSALPVRSGFITPPPPLEQQPLSAGVLFICVVRIPFIDMEGRVSGPVPLIGKQVVALLDV